MRLGAVAFLLGILVLQTLPELPGRVWTLGLPGVLALLAFVPRWRLPACSAAGFLWALWLAPPPVPIPVELEGVDMWVEGWIATIPDRGGRSTRFEFVVGQALVRGEESATLVGQRLRLSWWSDSTGIDNAAKAIPSLQVGDRWGFAVRLKRPHGLLNPGGFDYERWLYARGIVATGSIRSHPTPHLLAEAERYPLDRYRQQVAEAFDRLLPGNPQTGISTRVDTTERFEIHVHVQAETMIRTALTNAQTQ